MLQMRGLTCTLILARKVAQLKKEAPYTFPSVEQYSILIRSGLGGFNRRVLIENDKLVENVCAVRNKNHPCPVCISERSELLPANWESVKINLGTTSPSVLSFPSALQPAPVPRSDLPLEASAVRQDDDRCPARRPDPPGNRKNLKANSRFPFSIHVVVLFETRTRIGLGSDHGEILCEHIGDIELIEGPSSC
jgi:hypothetical protein